MLYMWLSIGIPMGKAKNQVLFLFRRFGKAIPSGKTDGNKFL